LLVLLGASAVLQECGWQDGDRGGPARTEGIHRKEKENRKKKHPYKKKEEKHP
jgi:hypothetical protein